MAGKKKEAKAAKVSIVKETRNGKEVTSRDQDQYNLGEESLFEDPPCNVGVSMGFTYNLGDYNSSKMQVSLNVPCAHEEINDAYIFAKEWVEERVNYEYEELDND